MSDIPRHCFIALIASAAFAPLSAYACSCNSPLLQVLYERSANVFAARVTGGETTGELQGNSPKIRMFFTETERFKGTVPFDHLSSHAEGGTCGLSLQIGVEYLVFAPDTGRIGLCTGIMPISGSTNPSQDLGSRYVAALRAFKWGQTDAIAEPWYFHESRGRCSLYGRFPYRNADLIGDIVIEYRATDDPRAAETGTAQLRAGFTRMQIRVPDRVDFTSFPLTLSVGSGNYVARWYEGTERRKSYYVDSDDVSGFVSDLVAADAVRLQSGHPLFGHVDTQASLDNAGDSVLRMQACMTAQTDNPKSR